MHRNLVENYGDPHLHFNRYPVPGRYCNGCGNQNPKPLTSVYDSEFAHIPRAINPASAAAEEYKRACGGTNGPHIGCVNHKYTCMKNGKPYDPKVNLVIPPYSMPYEANGCQQPVCNRGILGCSSK